jgi:hypothetical protein
VLASATAAATIQSAVAAIVGRPELPPQIDAALIDDLPEAAGAYAFYGEDGRLLLSRRSSNLRQQVLAHFTPDKRDSAADPRHLANRVARCSRRVGRAPARARTRPLGASRAAPDGRQRSPRRDARGQ